MKVEGTDILSDLTERTSRNLKTVAAIVIAIKYYSVPVDDLRILNVDLPGELFSVVSSVVIGYLIIVLVVHWLNDYMLWRNGPILGAKDALDRYVGFLANIIEAFARQEQMRGAEENVKYVRDQCEGIESGVLKYQRSVAMTTWWVRLVIFGLHLIIPLLLGTSAFAALIMIPPP